MTPRADSPPSKRIKLNASSSPPLDAARTVDDPDIPHDLDDSDVEQCSICLQPLADRTIIPKCSHEFCFECLLVWTEQSRKCPLCTQTIGDYLIHHVRSKYDYQKHYLTPLRSSSRLSEGVRAQTVARRRAQTRREQEWGRRRWREQEEADELERAIEHRRWVYRHKLYAKHVASNPYTRYKPFPTPAQFAASPDHISRATIFLRRELRVWPGLDVEFLTTFTISLMKSLDIRSEPAVRLLAEFLDMDNGGSRVNAEHFAHELYSFMRSPYRELPLYDRAVQYDIPEDVPPPVLPDQRRRWRARDMSRCRSRSRSEDRPRRRVQSDSPESSVSSRPPSPPRSPPRRRRRPSPRPRSIERSDPRQGERRSRSRDRRWESRDGLSFDRRTGHTDPRRIDADPAMLHPETTDHRPTSPQHHSTSQERPDTAPQHDRKGKGRARDDPIVSTGESSPAPTPDLRDTPPVQIMQPPTQSSASDLAQFAETTLKPSDRPRPVPRIRNRGLLESVHAHLAGRANQRDRDPNAPQISRARSTTQKSTPSAQSSSASAHEHKASSSRNSGTDSGHPGRPSLFERLSDSPSLPPSSSQSTGPSTPGGASHSSDDSAVARIVDARTRLLSKLLEEKCRHEVPTAADVSGARYADGLEQSASSTASCVGERPLPAEQEATDREAKLRSQALLRVRLAAAKKAASSQVAEPAPSSAEFSDVSSKEQMLKARLMQRRA